MAEIIPFKGLYFDTEKAGDISNIAAPPYDVISEHEIDKYYEKSPYNIIRLILPKNRNQGETGWQEKAAETFREWVSDGVLVADSKDSFYIYRQEYYVEEKKKVLTGLICALGIEDPGPGARVLPHEKTLGAPREDRFMLVKASMANFSPILGIFKDSKKAFLSSAARHADRTPLIDFRDDYEIRHTVLRVSGREQIEQIRKFIEDKTIFIADGHHRYEAARRLRDELKNKPHSHEGPFNYIMAYLADISDEGITILPAHRLVRGVPPDGGTRLMEKIRDFFHVEEEDNYEDVSLRMHEHHGSGGHSFGLFDGEKYYFLKLKEDSGWEELMERFFPESYKELDVSIAHGILINHISNGGTEMPEDNLQYEKDPQKCATLVEEKQFELAIFLNPTKIEQVLSLASSGIQMPGKATYFYPKPLGGLILRKF